MNDDRLPGSGESEPEAQSRSLSASDAQALLPAFVLGALEADEMLAMAAFLEIHPEWQKRVTALEVTAASLAHAAPRATLPARAKEQLLQRVQGSTPLNATLAATPQWAEPAPTVRKPFGRGKPPLQAPSSSLRGMRSIPPPQPPPVATGPHWFGIFWRSVASAGALAAIVLLAFIALQLRTNVADLSSQVATLQTELEQARSENAQIHQVNDTMRQELIQQQTQVAVLTNPEQTIALAGTELEPNASGNFVRRGDVAILTLRGLPPLAANQTYQLWLLPPAGDAIPADLLQVAGPTSETMTIAIAPQYQNLVGVGVSIEPGQGSQTPTDIVLLGMNA